MTYIGSSAFSNLILFGGSNIFGEEMKYYILMRRRTSTISPPSYVW